MKSLKRLVFLFCLCPLFFSYSDEAFVEPLPRHQLFIGPEIYHVCRTREGGAEQKGYLYGARAGYDYIRRYAFYVGMDALYAQGTLDGRAEEQKIRSTLIDANVEGRFGYTFQSKACHHASLTPYLGIGYFWEINKYKHPSPISVHFENNFYYVPVGFLSSVFVCPDLSVGVNFKARFIIDGKTKVTHDASFNNVSLRYHQHIQYRVELPITYYFCWMNQETALSLVPFYEYRHYGHQANFPFDFLETKFKIYGATLKLYYLF